MSHVDDGTLHAYLDGEATAVERERLEAHLAGCAPCRARLEEERDLIERAGRLLGLAAPPERPAPSFHELRRPRRGGRYRLPLAWAATIALAVGIGWYSRGLLRTPPAEPPPAQVAAESPAALAELRAGDSARDRTATNSAPSGRIAPRRDQPSSTPAPSSGAAIVTGAAQAADRTGRAEPAPPQPVADAAARLEADSARPVLRGVTSAAPTPGKAIVLTSPAANIDASIHRVTTSWPVIEPKRARTVLGEDPAVIPGYPIQALRRNPAVESEILVEQLVDSGVVLLYERRSDVGPVELGELQRSSAAAAMRKTNERLARYVRSLRVEIAGRLSADSLSTLLGLIR
ncbi:MAG TPA: zf-HC2 domain-containing protein [Gemmatimonadales bacterium]|nr:zf-HC2 domain-containing protein [Gemmatimonadales bacterium]